MLRILVIDDESFVREALNRVLTSPSTSVVCAEDATAGLVIMRRAPVDLVIVDVVLPGIDGLAAIKVLRRDFPRTRVIAISGGGNFGLTSYQPESISTTAYLAACGAAGADRILAKPFETAALRGMIEDLFGTAANLPGAMAVNSPDI